MPPLVALAAAAVLASCNRGEGGQVTFALSGPLKQDYGVSTQRGAELAAREINADNGINGQQLVLLAKDDEANQEKAIAIAAELVNDPRVVALAGPVNSGPPSPPRRSTTARRRA